MDDAEDDYASISIGGAHPRSNDIKVDGVSFNDDFGLNDNGYPSQRSPINLDSIEQMSVKVAPASVEYSNFRGGIIEFVTKGGTNEFEGSVGYYDEIRASKVARYGSVDIPTTIMKSHQVAGRGSNDIKPHDTSLLITSNSTSTTSDSSDPTPPSSGGGYGGGY